MASSKPIRRVQSRNLSEVPDQSKGNEGVKLQDKYEMYSIPDNSNGEFLSIRTIGGLVATKTHWVMLETKDGKQVSVPKACLNFDVEEQCIKEDNNCPYCRAEQWFKDHEVTAKDRNNRESNPCRSAIEHVTNAIVRDLQEDMTPRVTLPEEKKTGIINKGSKSKTPVRVIRLTGGVVSKFKDVEKLNVHKVKVKGQEERRSMPISHAKYGRDVMIKFNPKAKSASEYYGVQGGDKSPLEPEELAYLKWDIEAWPFENEPESLKDAESEIMRLKGKHWDKFRKHSGVSDQSDDYDDEDEDDFEDEMDDEEDERPSKKKGKAPAKSKSKSRRDEEDDEDEDDEDEPPRKSKSKAPAKGKGKSRRDDDEDEDDFDEDDEDDFDEDEDEDEDDFDDEDEDEEDFDDEDEDDEDEDDFDEDEDEDEDEDDEPPRKSKSKGKAPVKGKGKSRRDEEDEDEDDDFDDEDEDDEPPAKKKSSKGKAPVKGKGKSRRDEDEDEDDDLDDLDDEDDEDDEPPRKSSKSKSKAPAKGKGKSRRDEDEDEDDFDEDEDEDDEPPRKSKSKAPVKKAPAKGKGKSRRSDDDDDLPF